MLVSCSSAGITLDEWMDGEKVQHEKVMASVCSQSATNTHIPPREI